MLTHIPTPPVKDAVLLACSALLLSWTAAAQCPNVLNGDGEVVENPEYYFCTDGEADWTFYPQTDGQWTNVNVNWGDGTSTEHFAIWDEVNPISHTYPNIHEDYLVTFHSGPC